MMEPTHVIHPIEPVWDENSRILILGSFPSVRSREETFFYGHPQNRFWRVLATVFDCEIPHTVCEKRAFLLQNGIALWDVIAECDIKGSSDSTIRNAIPTELSHILSHADIKAIYVNGKTAWYYYQKYQEPILGRPAICLPSTSPANAAWSFERLVEEWRGNISEIFC